MSSSCRETLGRELQGLLCERVLTGEPLKNHTTWKVGGPADLMVIPRDPETVVTCLEWARIKGIPLVVMGNGSNVLVSDRGIRGLVLKTVGGLSGYTITEDRVVVQAGVKLPVLSGACARKGLSGLEFAAGIPGSLGGAVLMNAGAEGKDLGSLVRGVAVLEQEKGFHLLRGQDLQFDYRYCNLRFSRFVVMEVELELRPALPQEVKDEIRHLLARRRSRQPVGLPTAGSVFTNPRGFAAGALLEKAGLKGLTKGGASVSDKHANFVVAGVNATASDVWGLIEEMQERVFRVYGIHLELEVQLMGEWFRAAVS